MLCPLVPQCLDICSASGITTNEIDRVVHEAILERNAYPSPLGYGGFPKSCCTSINDVMCHGIPDSTVLRDGDIVNVDVTVYHDGFHGGHFSEVIRKYI